MPCYACPTITGSCFVEGCIENGRVMQQAGCPHRWGAFGVTGLANLVDSLAAIEECVFNKKYLTMAQLMDLLATNFEGREEMRQLLINRAPKYGNDIEQVDKYTEFVASSINREAKKYTDARGGEFDIVFATQSYNVVLGRMIGALPDGRKAFTPVADNASPMIGMDVNGPTAVVKSVNSGGRRNAQGGYLLNQRFDPHIVRGEKGVDILEAVLRAHFGSEGEHIQLNVVDNETLRDAQEHPENYRNLLVRGGRIFGFLCGSGGKHTGKYHRADHTEGRLNPQPSAACPCRKRRMRERQAPGQQHRRGTGRAALPGKEHPDRTGEKERKMLFENKKVLITGAGRGIGRQTAIEMAKEGAVILGLGRTAGPLEEMAGAVGAAGGKSIYPDCRYSKL